MVKKRKKRKKNNDQVIGFGVIGVVFIIFLVSKLDDTGGIINLLFIGIPILIGIIVLYVTYRTFYLKKSDRLLRLQHQTLEQMRSMNAYEFEKLAAAILRENGYWVRETQKSNDEGIDLLLSKGGRRYLAQVKRYASTNKIGRPDLNKFRGAMEDKRIRRGLFVTTSSFTKFAQKYASRNGIKLIDGETLVKMHKIK